MTKLSYGRVISKADRKNTLLDLHHIAKRELRKLCSEYVISPSSVVIQEKPLSVQYVIKAYDRLSLKLTDYGLYSEKFPTPPNEN